MIDTHCHLTDPRLHEQLDDVLNRAQAAGITRMITIGTDLADARRCIDLCRQRPQLRCAVGIHPHHAAGADLAQLPLLRDMHLDDSVLAIGEMGLDYHYAFSPRQRQRQVFESQLDLAAKLDRPVVIHCREAVDDTLAILLQQPKVPAVFHCFTGSVAEAERILAAGYLLGFTGAITFRKSDALREVVQLTPLDRLLIETDAPYLSPEPLRRQKINEPALLVHTAAEVARLKGVSVEAIGHHSDANARRFFSADGW